MPFPDLPRGDPGAIAGCASTLHRAADDLEQAETGLLGANGSLESDWQGFAAQAYYGASNGLVAVARGAGDTFRGCASAVSRYGAELDQVQSELRGLRSLYDDAVRRQAAANGLAGKLQSALASAHAHSEISTLGSQIGTAQNQAQDALTEANGYARRADDLVNAFRGRAQAYAATLDGQEPGHAGPLGPPFIPAGTPGSGFGIPSPGGFPGVNPDGLDAYRGVLPVGDPWNSNIPGYGTHMDATHGNLTSPDDLTNLAVLIASFGVAGAVRDLGGAALRSVLESAGSRAAGREALDGVASRITQQTLSEVYGSATDVGDRVVSTLGRDNTAELVEQLGGVLDGHLPGAGPATQIGKLIFKAGGPSAIRAGVQQQFEDLAGITDLKQRLQQALQRVLVKLVSSPSRR